MLPERYRPFLAKYPSLLLIGDTRPFRVPIPEIPKSGAERKKHIFAYGARIVETDPVEVYGAALREAHRLAEEQPGRYYMADQYANGTTGEPTARRRRKRTSDKGGGRRG